MSVMEQKPGRTRRSFTDEFKRDAVAMVLDSVAYAHPNVSSPSSVAIAPPPPRNPVSDDISGWALPADVTSARSRDVGSTEKVTTYGFNVASIDSPTLVTSETVVRVSPSITSQVNSW